MPDLDRTQQLIDRFCQVPVLDREVWQGAVVRLPDWIDPGEGGQPFRPFGAVWTSLSTGHMTVELEPAAEAHGPDLLVAGLLRFGRQEKKEIGGRAGRLQVADVQMRDRLESALGSAVHVEIVPRLDALAEILREYTNIATGDQPPSALEGPGVTLNALKDFADAAAKYHAAAPWQHLSDEDLVEIESPAAPAGYRFALVLGNGGHTFGLAFYASREQHEAMLDAASAEDAADVLNEEMDVARSIVFDTADGIPIKDHDSLAGPGPPAGRPARVPVRGVLSPGRRGHPPRPAGTGVCRGRPARPGGVHRERDGWRTVEEAGSRGRADDDGVSNAAGLARTRPARSARRARRPAALVRNDARRDPALHGQPRVRVPRGGERRLGGALRRPAGRPDAIHRPHAGRAGTGTRVPGLRLARPQARRTGQAGAGAVARLVRRPMSSSPSTRRRRSGHCRSTKRHSRPAGARWATNSTASPVRFGDT